MRWVTRDSARIAGAKAVLTRRALERAPSDGNLWHGLGRQHTDAGQPEKAAEAFREAARWLPYDMRVRLELAGALIRLDAHEEALAVIQAALRITPEDPTARIREFEVLVQMGNAELARAKAVGIAELDPANPLLLRFWRNTAHGTVELEALLQRCNAVLACRPGDTAATHHKAMTLARLGRDAEACTVMDYRPLVTISDLATPEGFAGIGTFCTALTDELQRNLTFIQDASGRITENVLVSVNLEQPSNKAMPLLLQQIRRQIENYDTKLSGVAMPPAIVHFASARPEVARLHAWGVIHKARGRIRTHFHYSAWLSGVFYVAAPRADHDGPFGGPLHLGAVDESLAPRTSPPWPIIEVEPTPGRLILFPAYVPHATAPAVGDGDRICVSFDVMRIGTPARN